MQAIPLYPWSGERPVVYGSGSLAGNSGHSGQSEHSEEISQEVRHRRHALFIAALGLVAVAVGTSSWGLTRLTQPPPPTAQTVPVTGTVSLIDQGVTRFAGDPCAGSGGFADLHEGTELVVTNRSGDVIGLTRLEAGHGEAGSNNCVFPFAVNVPAGLGFYGFEVAHRKVVHATEDVLAGPVRLTVGG